MRLVVIGPPASHDLAHLDLDTIAWEPKRIAVPRAPAAARADLERFVAEHEGWVVEGCYADLAGSPRRSVPSWCS